LKTAKPAKPPKPLSFGEETLALHLRCDGLPVPEREYVFAPPRKFRFDLAWPDIKLAVECDGGTKYGLSRHSRGAGYENDCRKMNIATGLGWRVLRFTTAMIVSGEAIQLIRELAKDGYEEHS
jgi:very-short-patch-repair endonuclease